MGKSYILHEYLASVVSLPGPDPSLFMEFSLAKSRAALLGLVYGQSQWSTRLHWPAWCSSTRHRQHPHAEHLPAWPSYPANDTHPPREKRIKSQVLTLGNSKLTHAQVTPRYACSCINILLGLSLSKARTEGINLSPQLLLGFRKLG